MASLLELLVESEEKVNFILSNPKTVEQLKSRIASDSKVPEGITPKQLVHNFDNISIVVSKFLPWVVKRYCVGDFEYTDLNLANNCLNDFVKNSNKLQNKDINSYKSLSDLNKAVSEVKEQKTSHDLKREAKSEAEKVYENNNWMIIVPHTKRASVQYGKGTKWCTAAKNNNMFDFYNDQGSLYIIINKHSPEEKYQFHYKTQSYMDASDQSIDLYTFLDKNPSLKEFFKQEFNITRNSFDWFFYCDKKDMTKEMCLKFIEQGTSEMFDGIDILKYIPYNFRDQDVCLQALKIDSRNIKYVPENILTPEFLNHLIDVNKDVVTRIPKNLITRDLIVKGLAKTAHVHGIELMYPEFFETEEEKQLIFKDAVAYAKKYGGDVEFLKQEIEAPYV